MCTLPLACNGRTGQSRTTASMQHALQRPASAVSYTCAIALSCVFICTNAAATGVLPKFEHKSSRLLPSLYVRITHLSSITAATCRGCRVHGPRTRFQQLQLLYSFCCTFRDHLAFLAIDRTEFILASFMYVQGAP